MWQSRATSSVCIVLSSGLSGYPTFAQPAVRHHTFTPGIAYRSPGVSETHRRLFAPLQFRSRTAPRRRVHPAPFSFCSGKAVVDIAASLMMQKLSLVLSVTSDIDTDIFLFTYNHHLHVLVLHLQFARLVQLTFGGINGHYFINQCSYLRT